MKTFIVIILAATSLFSVSCKSVDSVSKQEEIAQITNKIESRNYTFVPQRAIPMEGKAINLDSSFSLKVSKDTINSYLPYYGRAYTAQPLEGGGIKFVSTDFKYNLAEDSKGMRNIVIEANTTNNKYKMYLSIGNTGSATLTVQDNNRQSITFYGDIE
ncbi:MAG: DUF4251 domain-containing protein [Prevotella sp.]|nr:DUF4251 domain-containing protein [Prevotella sp.]